ncbi:MAG TPA: trypsin-like peptidase domain-containing protein [Patescibacteria group bacterium]|nr:trypsin-like peptidase domain-containing protein [Patescibacteria group bacterium]
MTQEKEKHIVDELYGEHGRVYRPADRKVFLASLIAAVLFGAGAGVVGDFLAKTYLYEYFYGVDIYSYPYVYLGAGRIPTEESDNDSLISVKSVSAEDFNEIEKRINQTANEVKRAIVNVYAKKKLTGDLIADAYLSENRMGQGVILTSDGWIISNRNVISQRSPSDQFVVTFERHVYDIEQTVFDESSGIVFFKINATRLPVIALGDQDTLKLGQMLLTIGSSQEVTNISLQSENYLSFDKAGEMVQSTEFFSQRLLLDGPLGIEYEGSPVFTLDGKIVGILTQTLGTDMANTAIPINNFKSVIADVFRGGEIERPYLGVEYLDLAHVVFESATFQSLGFAEPFSRGALVTSFKSPTDPVKENPASLAGVLVHDIILKVNDDVVDANSSLTELLAAYQSGDTLTLELSRASKIMDIVVILQSQKKSNLEDSDAVPVE